ncbi:MAG: sensor histidine kinase [Chloroflexi bacterium]|nr:sensor histidine kinase [Chloroflexota bacterium]
MVVRAHDEQLQMDARLDTGLAELADEVLAAIGRAGRTALDEGNRSAELAEICWHLGWAHAQADEPLDAVVGALRTLASPWTPNSPPDTERRRPLCTVVLDCLTSLWRGYSAALQAAAVEAMELAEAERRRLTQELHDETGQHLTACLFQIDHCLELAPGAAAFTGHLRRAREQLLHCSREVQRISSSLSPRLLEESGLVVTLEWFLARYRDQYGLEVDAQIAADLPELPLASATAVFRIVQEATTNVARHAGARRVIVRLWRDERAIHLTIADDGVGCGDRSGETGRRAGLGLVGMSTRARQLGGRLSVGDRPGGGTQVVLTFPIPRRPISPISLRRG